MKIPIVYRLTLVDNLIQVQATATDERGDKWVYTELISPLEIKSARFDLMELIYECMERRYSRTTGIIGEFEREIIQSPLFHIYFSQLAA